MEEKKKNAKSPKAATKDPKLIELEEKLEKKRQERLRAASATKITPSKQSAGRTRSMVKEKVGTDSYFWFNWSEKSSYMMSSVTSPSEIILL